MSITVTSNLLFASSLAAAFVHGYDRKKLIDHILLLEAKASSVELSNAGGYQSPHYDNRNYDNIYAKELLDEQILPTLHSVADLWALPRVKNLSYWYNINRKFNYNHQHYHPGAVLSGVFYLAVPTNSGNIVFMRSHSESDRMDHLTRYQLETRNYFPDNINTNTMNKQTPKENLLFIFPSHLEHYVEQNNTDDIDDKRISISFNYFLG